MNKRVEYLDSAKGLLIILMLIGHIWNEGWVRDFIYAFHMPAFFIISGILMNHTSTLCRSLTENLIIKVKTLLMPYICFEIFAILIDILINGMTLNINGYLFEMVSLHLYNGPLWFLFVMFLSQMLFLMLTNFFSRKYWGWMLALLGGSLLFLPKFPQYINMTTTVMGLFYLMIGFYVEGCFAEMQQWRGFVPLAFLITAVIATVNGVGMPDYQDGNRCLFIIGSMTGSYFVLSISKRVTADWVRFFGRNSLIILGNHYPILRLVKHILGIEEFSILGGTCFLAILLLIETPIIWAIHRFFPFVLGRPYKRKLNP